jgi:hypothetical protein
MQLVSYCIITVNFRAVAAGHYVWTAVTDLVYAGLAFFIIQRVSHVSTTDAWVGYTLGGVVGAQIGIYMSKRLWSKSSEPT